MAARRPTDTQLHTVKEVGARLEMSHDSVRRLIDAGEIEAVDVGTGGRPRLRVSESALLDFVRRRTLPRPERRPRVRTDVVRIAAETPRRRSS